MNYRKSQAAFEFLITYGWIFLVILATISALYYFGIFDFAKYLPQKCIFPSQFRCIDFSMKDAPAGQVDIRFRLLNDIGELIHVESLSITNDAATPLTCTPQTVLPFDWDDDEEKDFEFTDCSGGVFIKGERTEAEITFTYYSPLTNPGAEPRHSVKGKIIGIVG